MNNVQVKGTYAKGCWVSHSFQMGSQNIPIQLFTQTKRKKEKKKKNSSWLTMKMFSSVPFVKNNTFISYRYWPTRHVYICSFMTQNMQLYWVTMSTVCTVDLLSCCQLIFAFHLSVASPDKVTFSTEDMKTCCPEAYARNKHIWHSYAPRPNLKLQLETTVSIKLGSLHQHAHIKRVVSRVRWLYFCAKWSVWVLPTPIKDILGWLWW